VLSAKASARQGGFAAAALRGDPDRDLMQH
jgi:hypothetical protein